MKVSRPNASVPSPRELEDLDKLKSIVERAIADGKLSKQEMQLIQAAIQADGKVTCEELAVYRQLVLDKIQNGELEYAW